MKDAPIVILDEATSHSDIENERKIQRALDHLLKDKMTIIIAHRLHTIKEADIIYVFDEGEIIEYGAHAQLMNKQGRYYQMWQSYTKYEKGYHSMFSNLQLIFKGQLKRMYLPIGLSILDTFGTATMYGALYYVIVNIVQGSFTSDVLKLAFMMLIGSFVIRVVFIGFLNICIS